MIFFTVESFRNSKLQMAEILVANYTKLHKIFLIYVQVK